MPTVFLTNANRIMNKLDELYVLISNLKIDVVAVTESWLGANIPDSVLHLPNFSIVRHDRQGRLGGGVMLFIRNDNAFKKLDDLLDSCGDFEILWVLLRPKLLPRDVSVLILSVVYFPPWYDVATFTNLCFYIVNCVDRLKQRYPGAGFLIMGDFNQVDTKLFNKHLCFNQIVNFATRGANILDKIFTNIARFYSSPIRLPPLGKSDHCCILLSSEGVKTDCAGYSTITRRKVNGEAVSMIGRRLMAVNWNFMYRQDNCQDQADFFDTVIDNIFNDCVPLTSFRVKNNDKPWINHYFRQLLVKRDIAWRSGDMVLYRKLRNRANRCRFSLRTQFYQQKVDQLKETNARDWWRHIKVISGMSNGAKNNINFYDNVLYGNETVNVDSFPNVFNNFMSSLAAHVKPFDCNILSRLRENLDVVPEYFIVDELSVFNVLNKVKVDKAVCDTFLNNRMLREFSDVLAGPICALINSSIRQGYVPSQWKLARITPIPKINPPKQLESDFRPISITSCVSKVAEFFLCKFFNEHFSKYLDRNQFGSTAKRSTTLALIKFSHFLFSESDKPHNILRILFVDFTKAFDLVDSNVLYKKFTDLNFPPHITTWFLSFLVDRRQYVRVGNLTSSIVSTHAGTPQGTLSGPNDFRLLINDLSFNLFYEKYVDDTTAVSSSDDPLDDALQNAANYLCGWCKNNGMQINVFKTTEMIIYFGKLFGNDFIPALKIGNTQIRRVESFKLLGVVFSSDLSWSFHVSYILQKVSRRFFIIWQLMKSGISIKDVIIVYCSLMRSVLEYACPVWHCGLTSKESSDIEGVQRRVLRIVWPDLGYNEALNRAGLERLDVRREKFVRETFEMVKEPGHVLYDLLPKKSNRRTTRDKYPFELPRHNTARYCRSFVTYCIKRYY